MIEVEYHFVGHVITSHSTRWPSVISNVIVTANKCVHTSHTKIMIPSSSLAHS